MNDDDEVSTSITWSHTPSNEVYRFMQVACPCGLMHQVDDIKPGGMTVIDCVCGLVLTVEH